MDCDASFDPRELPRVADPVAAGRADLVLGARSAAAAAGWPLHARAANALLAAELRRRTRVPLRDLGPMRAARREALLALGLRDRRFGWPLEMVLRAAAAGWRIDEVTVTQRPRAGRSKVTGTVRGTVRASATWARCSRDARRPRHRQGAGRRAGQDAALPAVHARAGRAARPRCAAGHARRRGRRRRRRAACSCSTARPARGSRPAGRSSPQRGDGLAERLAAAFEDAGAPAFLVGMDTPQLTPALIRAGLRALATHDAAFGPAADGGYWGIGLRRARRAVFQDIPMSEPHTGRAQRRRLQALGLRTAELPALLDVDTIAAARAVAAAAPESRFAATLAELAA